MLKCTIFLIQSFFRRLAMSKLLNVLLYVMIITGASNAITTNWKVPVDPAEGGAPWGTAANWDLGLPGTADTAFITNPTGKFYCVFDRANDPGIISDTTVITNLYVGSTNIGAVVDGELIIESGTLAPNRFYIGHTDYINRVGRIIVNNAGKLFGNFDVYVGPTPGANDRERSGGILILNDTATARDRFNYNYFTRVGGNPGEMTSNQSLLQLNDSSIYNATRFEIGQTGTVDVRDSAKLNVRGGTDGVNQYLRLKSYVDMGRLIADGGASKALVVQGTYAEVTASPRPGGADITAWSFDPADESLLTTSGTATLRWIRGYHPSNDPNTSGVDTFSLAQRVYLSSTESLVVSREPSVLVGSLTKEQAFDVSGLLVGHTYYWTVDCEYADTTVGYGAINSFFTINPIESFENYADTAALQAVWGANATLAAGGYLSQKAMSVSYNGADVSVSAAGSWNLLQSGAEKALVLKFKGALANDEVTMSITLKDNLNNTSSVVYDGDMPYMTAAVRSIDWVSWNIDLDDFAGINLANIVHVQIGIQTNIATTHGGVADGTILFDEIMTMPPFVLGKPYMGDVSGDGVVNMDDLELLWGTYQAWLFDGNVTDDAAVAMVKQLAELGNVNEIGVAEYAAGRLTDTQAVRLQGSLGQWIDINDFLVGNFRNSTVSVWVKFNDIVAETESFIIGTGSEWRLYISLFGGKLRIQGPAIFADGITVAEGQWYHIALTTADTADGLTTSRAYLDGVLLATDAARPRHIGSRLLAVAVGTRNQGYGLGSSDITVSDLRFYDTVLSDAQVAQLKDDAAIAPVPTVRYTFDGTLANSGSRTSVSAPYLNNPLDINLDGVINYGDFAIIAGQWSEDILFPYED